MANKIYDVLTIESNEISASGLIKMKKAFAHVGFFLGDVDAELHGEHQSSTLKLYVASGPLRKAGLKAIGI